MAKPERMTSIDLIIDLLKDPDRKPLFKILTESTFLFFFYRRIPRQYISRYLFKKGISNISDFMPDKFLYNIKSLFNENEVREVLENKLYFDFFYRQFDVSLPKIIMYNHRNIFVTDKKYTEISSVNEFKLLIEDIFIQNPSFDSLFIKKTYWSFGGDKIFKLFRTQVTSDQNMISSLYSEVIKTGFLFQETVVQHPDLNRLNPSCLNTMRIDTFIDRDGKIEVMSAFIRMSISNNHVDNISSGGCYVGINIATCKLKKDGFLSVSKYGVKILTIHPITDITFENFTIPLFSEAKELVIKTASLMPGLRMVGWDVAIGPSGPVLIEGNSDYNNTGNDLTDGGFRANPVFRKALHEINYL